jgi:hypothetical protein
VWILGEAFTGNPSEAWFRPVMCCRYPLKKSAIGGTSPWVSSNGLYSDGGQVGRRRFSTSRTPFSGISIFSRICPTISSKARITGVRYLSARLKARTVSEKISWTYAGVRQMTG